MRNPRLFGVGLVGLGSMQCQA